MLASKGEGGNYTQTYMRGAAAHTHLPPREKYNLANALVLKNDEAGITGVTLQCSNTYSETNDTTLETHANNMKEREEAEALCFGKGKKLCHPTQIDISGEDYQVGWTKEGVVVADLDGEGGDRYKIVENRNVCFNRDTTKEECDRYAKGAFDAGDATNGTANIVDTDQRPPGCSVGFIFDAKTAKAEESIKNAGPKLRVFWNNKSGSSARGDILCPSTVVAQKTLTQTSKHAFCCNKNLPLVNKYSDVGHSTDPGQNKHVHHEFMCVSDDGTPPAYLCDPETETIVDVDGSPLDFGDDDHRTCKTHLEFEEGKAYSPNRSCQYVPVDVDRSGNDYMYSTNPEGRFYHDNNKVYYGTAGNNATVKDYHVSCRKRGGVCGLAAKAMEIETTHGMKKDGGRWGPGKGNSTQFWFESIKRAGSNLETLDGNFARALSNYIPDFGNHRQDMQGITNVEVMCCDGTPNSPCTATTVRTSPC